MRNERSDCRQASAPVFRARLRRFRALSRMKSWLILAALVTVYIVLGVLYESYIHPITILSTLPSAGVGAILALQLSRIDFSVIALIGIILLIGIVQKNAIMMIDFALEAQRKEGKSPIQAIYQACLLRFRPILMTTMAAMLGGVPLAFGTGVGAELRRPLGITIIGGLDGQPGSDSIYSSVSFIWLSAACFRLRGLASEIGIEERGCWME